MQQTSRQRAQTQTRQALIEAAAILVASRGFGGAAIGDIAAAAGFTKGAFYSNFESGEAMALALLGHVKEEQAARLAALGSLEGVARWAADHATDPVAPLLAAEGQLQARRDPAFLPDVRAGFESQLDLLSRLIEAAAKTSGQRPAMPARKIARTVLALVQGLAQQPAAPADIAEIVRLTLKRLLGR